jgi:hypothetical protein
MTGSIKLPGNDKTPESSEKAKKPWGLNALILAAVFLLTAVLPPGYKAFAPFLFLIPVILNVVNKVRQADENPANPAGDRTYSPPVSNRIPSSEPYSYKQKDPKDPRKYKPIG